MPAAASRKSAASHAPPVQAAIVVAGVVAMWGASFVSIPIGPVPITLQTFAVCVLAGLFGGRLGLVIVLAWLTAAALGAPVLANGVGGWKAVTGHTAGFLAGMAAAAYLCGEGARRVSGWLPLTLVFLGGHVMVLAAGWAGLASFMSPGPAFQSGILPLLPGAAVKSLAAALTVRLVSR
ncbi:MAG: biotin transporter BioY [Phenylobacterium sp.]|nr:biotin transporter BioY [Phenylobacterium sp.]